MKDSDHKFNDTLVMTYTQYFRTMTSRTISLIRMFQEAFGSEEVQKVLVKWSEKVGESMVTSSIVSFSEFKNHWKNTLESENWAKTVTCSFLKETDRLLACKYTECLWAETMKDMDAQDIGYTLFCYPDFAMAKTMNPKLNLKRTMTLMQGDEFCDHVYEWGEQSFD